MQWVAELLRDDGFRASLILVWFIGVIVFFNYLDEE